MGIVELVGIHPVGAGQLAGHPGGDTGEDTVGDRRRVSQGRTAPVPLQRVSRGHRRRLGTERVLQQAGILLGRVLPSRAQVLQRHEQRELVAVGADQDGHIGDPPGAQRHHGILGQNRAAVHRPAEGVFSDPVVPHRFLQLVHRQGAQAGGSHRWVAAAHLPRIVRADPLGGRQRQLRLTRPALDDRRPEQAGGPGRDQVIAHRHRTGGLTGDGHLVRVAAERRDVVAHPTQRRLLVRQTVVADGAGRPQRRMRQKAERTETVVERDDDDIAPVDEPARVVHAAVAVDERTAMDPNHHRPKLFRRRWSPDVEGQAVLVGLPAHLQVAALVLDAARPHLGGVVHARPGPHRLRRLPAQWPHRRGRIGNAGKVAFVEGRHPAQQARAGRDDRRVRRQRRRPLGMTTATHCEYPDDQ